jgi:DNA-binding PadR family transcriptional regulator
MVPDTRYAILGLLASKPSHGYELAIRFGELFGPGWDLNTGQVYDMLGTLRKKGWAERDGQKVHRITQAGDQALTEWHASPCAVAQSQRETIYLKLALARPQDAPHLLESIGRQEQACVDLLARYTEEAPSLPEGASDWEILARAWIDEATTTGLHGELEWLSKMRKRIESFLERTQSATVTTTGDESFKMSDSAA